MVEREKNPKPETPAPPEPKVSGFRAWLRDVAYTFNHALACLTTDALFQPFVGAGVYGIKTSEKLKNSKNWEWVSRLFEKIGKGFEYQKKFSWSGCLGEAWHWLRAEAIGDISAVPVTALIARIPGVTKVMRGGLKPLMGRFFEKGAARDAAAWAKEHGVDPHGPEAEAKKKELYEYEVGHLPHMVIWNILSTGFTVSWMLFFTKHDHAHGHGHGDDHGHGHEHGKQEPHAQGTWGRFGAILQVKIFGMIVSNLMLLTLRAAFPDRFQRHEQAISRATEKLLGVEEHHEEAPAARTDNKTRPQQEGKHWENNVRNDRAQPAQSVSVI